MLPVAAAKAGSSGSLPFLLGRVRRPAEFLHRHIAAEQLIAGPHTTPMPPWPMTEPSR